MKEDLTERKNDTAAISVNRIQIKQDTSQIEILVQQIGFLRLRLESASIEDAKAQHLQQFLEKSTAYAETVIDTIEDDLEDGAKTKDRSPISSAEHETSAATAPLANYRQSSIVSKSHPPGRHSQEATESIKVQNIAPITSPLRVASPYLPELPLNRCGNVENESNY